MKVDALYLVVIFLGIISYSTSTKECGENEVWDGKCGTCDEKSCINGTIGNTLCLRCAPGCRCAPYFYRDENDQCISGKDCCKLPNHVYIKHGPYCPEYCNKDGNVVQLACGIQGWRSGCFCAKGYIHKGKDCIKKSDCLPPCHKKDN